MNNFMILNKKRVFFIFVKVRRRRRKSQNPHKLGRKTRDMINYKLHIAQIRNAKW